MKILKLIKNLVDLVDKNLAKFDLTLSHQNQARCKEGNGDAHDGPLGPV